MQNEWRQALTLVAGIDSSTQSCKVVIRDADSGELVRSGRAPHPDGTEVWPERWWSALTQAIAEAGGLADVAAASIGGQQHGLVALDDAGAVVRPALLWNDTRSAGAARDLIAELPGGAAEWARAVGSVPVASFTVTKLRWLAAAEPENAARTAAVCLPHDWLTWKLRGRSELSELVTDRSDASGTGYFSPTTNEYRADLLKLAFGRDLALPTLLRPSELVDGLGIGIGAGAGDNAAAALGVNAIDGDVIVSIGTSGTVFALSATPTADASGAVAGFASATGDYLPLVATLNAARVLDAAARMLGVSHEVLSALALAAPPGADGLVLVPYLEGERTPNRPDASGAIHGLTNRSATPSHLARAAVEGLLCGLADGLDALVALGVRVQRIILIGGGARSSAVREIAPSVFGHPVVVPPPGEYVADGAARQAAWALSGSAGPPTWPLPGTETFDGVAAPVVREQYAAARELTVSRRVAAERDSSSP
jgi:xylulokinase